MLHTLPRGRLGHSAAAHQMSGLTFVAIRQIRASVTMR
jgi:hypothetical protein